MSAATFGVVAVSFAMPTRFINGDGLCGGQLPCHTTVVAAVNAAADGEVLEVQSDSAYAENVDVTGKTGITIQAAPGASPSITPAGGFGLRLFSSPGFTLDGVDIELPKSGADDAFVVWSGPCDGLTIRNLRLRGTRDALDVDTSIDGIVIDNVEFLNAADDFGAELDATDFGGTISNVTISNSRFIANFKHLMLRGDVRDVTIQGNVFDRTTYGEGLLIEALALTAGPISISGNKILDSQEQAILVRGANASNVTITGNTIVQRSTFGAAPEARTGVVFRDTGAANVVRDNIVVANGNAAAYAIAVGQGVTFDHNLQFDWGVGVEDPGDIPVVLDPTSIDGDPVLFNDASNVDDFRLGCASADVGSSSTNANMGAVQSLTPAVCAVCAGPGTMGDADGDDVDGCVDACPATPTNYCVDSSGCRVRDVLIAFGEDWNFEDTGADASATFRTTLLASVGPAPIGFGEGDEATVLATPGVQTYYFNKSFAIADPSAVAGLTLDVHYDDGYIVYVNGDAVARSDNMLGVPATFAAGAVFDGENWLDRGIVIPGSVLIPGANLISVEIHQETANSDDLSFDVRLVSSPLCAGVCGDGSVSSIEECDDGNTDDGDGCDSGCLLEDKFCLDGREPSVGRNAKAVAFVSNEDYLGTNADGNGEVYLFRKKDYDKRIRRGEDPVAALTASLVQLTNTPFSVFNMTPSINGNGRFVAFVSSGDLVPAIGNADENLEIFDLDVKRGTLTQVTDSVTVDNLNPNLRAAKAKLLIFDSPADLVSDLCVGGEDDLAACTNNSDCAGTAVCGNPEGNREVFEWVRRAAKSGGQAIRQLTASPAGTSTVGRSVNFNTKATAFSSTGDLLGGNPEGNAEVYRIVTKADTLVQITETGAGVTNKEPAQAKKRRIVLVSDGDLDPTVGNADGNDEVFVWRENETPGYQQITNTELCESGSPTIDSRGRFVAFDSTCNLIPSKGNPDQSIFVYDAMRDQLVTRFVIRGPNNSAVAAPETTKKANVITFEGNLGSFVDPAVCFFDARLEQLVGPELEP